ncbi:molybdate ABC transporter substrate-binding protein [Roseivivax sp. CAU 1753]
MRLIVLALLAMTACPVAAAEITVFAAASTRDALRAAADRWTAQTGHDVRIAPAGSSVLARQIARGAPADLFLSANADWMDWLSEQGAIRDETRVTLLGNRLVLIGHGAAAAAADPPGLLQPGDDLIARLGPEGRLAMALVDAVPAGIYGKAALETLGLWDALRPRLAEADNVRAALALVALGEAPLGIVYASDAAAEPRVHIVARIAEDAHPPIRYPAAVTRTGRAPTEAAALLIWLQGPQAQAIFAAHGFAAAPG